VEKHFPFIYMNNLAIGKNQRCVICNKRRKRREYLCHCTQCDVNSRVTSYLEIYYGSRILLNIVFQISLFPYHSEKRYFVYDVSKNILIQIVSFQKIRVTVLNFVTKFGERNRIVNDSSRASRFHDDRVLLQAAAKRLKDSIILQ